MAEIVIGGDICPINRNLQSFIAGNASAIFNDLLPEFEGADLSIVNLECPLIDEELPTVKNGPVLGVDWRAVEALRRAHISVVNLANNHVLDHGSGGLKSTMSACENAGILIVGAGENLQRAGEVLIRNINGVRVGLYACAEREFSIAGKETAGANPLNLAEFVRSMRLHRSKVDYLIVLMHGGTQHYPYPSPQLQDTCRFMVEEGADAVICQHSHCAGCFEVYGKGYIVYGQGNLIFDRYPKRSESFYTGYLVKLSIGLDFPTSIHIIPYRQSDAVAGARKMSKSEVKQFLDDLHERNQRVLDPSFVERQWGELCKKNKYDCFSTLSGYGRLLRYINRRIHFSNLLYSTTNMLSLQNLLRCESHKEMLEKILFDMITAVKR